MERTDDDTGIWRPRWEPRRRWWRRAVPARPTPQNRSSTTRSPNPGAGRRHRLLHRWASGELTAADVDVPDASWGMQPMTDLLGSANLAPRRVLTGSATPASSSGDPGARVRRAVATACWPRRTVVDEIDLRVRAAASSRNAARDERCADRRRPHRRRSTSATTGRPPRRGGVDAGRPSAWIERACSPSCPLMPRIVCSTTSPR